MNYERSIFSNLSPLDHRYSLSSPGLFAALSSLLSEEAVLRSELHVEATVLKIYAKKILTFPDAENIIDKALASVNFADVYAEEQRTKHHIRALVRVFQAHLPPKLASYVHLGMTSMDIIDTAASFRYQNAVFSLVLPLIIRLICELKKLAEAEIDTPQISRTHGQHALPIRVGYFYAEYLSRLGRSAERIIELTENLEAKISGAVGAYHATGLIMDDPVSFEKDVLETLDLKKSEYSTQIVCPEALNRLLSEMTLCFSTVANLADDLRHLQRTEINEFFETFEQDQVGSSTMPHKRNPWNCEHVKSLWKAAIPRSLTFTMDNISEHQRDLTGSASSRFIPDFFSLFCLALERMSNIIESLQSNRKQMAEAFKSDHMVTEAFYILLSAGGKKNAYEKMRNLSREAQEKKKQLHDVMLEKAPEIVSFCDKELKKRGLVSTRHLCENPEIYAGKTRAITEDICHKTDFRIQKVTNRVEVYCHKHGFSAYLKTST